LRNRKNGVALLACLLALMLLTAIALGLMYLGDAETRTNDNFRSSQQAYFASMAGLQNVRERMMLANVGAHQIVAPLAMPGSANSVVYVLNPAGGSDVVAPANASNPYYDQELCREMAAEDMNCPLPGNNIVTTAENGPPYLNTPAALPYKWVRINRKANASDAPYYNNGSAGNSTLTTQVCWNGVSEMPVTLLPVTDCALSAGSDPAGWSPVYELTSLAVTANGASRLLQMEVAQDPPLVTRGAVDSQDHVDLNGSLVVNGWDFCTCQCTTSKVNGVTSPAVRIVQAWSAMAPTTLFMLPERWTILHPRKR
jgi:Tfp pilus assembly protein PilV